MKLPLIILPAALILAAGCSKKHQPQAAEPAVKVNSSNTTAEKKVKAKIPLATVITVDDRAATLTPDGRLYYDLGGKRYWKNYNDGKYYLFNKKMYTDPAFKPH